MSYELWDMDTGNLVAAFDSETSALTAAGELMALNADVYPTMLTLLAVGERGELTTIASGEALGARVDATTAKGQRRSQ